MWASRFNQLSLLPFLAFLWTLWHIPDAPKRAVHGFTFYLVFIAVGIPAGIYCRQQLGTSMANADWIHGELVVTAPSTIAMLLYSSSELATFNCSSKVTCSKAVHEALPLCFKYQCGVVFGGQHSCVLWKSLGALLGHLLTEHQ